MRQVSKEMHMHRTTIHKYMRIYYGAKRWAKILAGLMARRGFQQGSTAGTNTRFKSGHKKGMATRWVKGQLRGRAARLWKPVGSLMVKRIKYGPFHKRFHAVTFIKVKDEPNALDNWMPYARWLWQQKYGPIPKGHAVVALDGNRSHDNDIENLACMALPDYQRYLEARFPDKLAQRKRRLSVSLRKYRRDERLRDKKQIIWECPNCAFSSTVQLKRCPKCGHTSFERIVA